jgi:hypothetical protein
MDINELLNEIQQTPEVNFLDLLNECSIDLAEEMPKPDILLSIGTHEYKGNSYPTPIMTSGEFSCIVAVSKAKKSFLKSQLLASYIGGNANLNFKNIKTHREEDFTVLDFDTEQGRYYAQRTFRRVQEITGFIYDYYHCYVTRHLTSRQRLEMIDFCLKNQDTLYKKKVKLISIDGVADLVENTNDIVMSKEASDYIMRWTYEYNIHITTVIHKSGLTGKPLGHLGTYVLKKSESVIELEVNEDSSVTVSNPYSRGIPFDLFSFDIDKNSLPYLIE